MNHNSGWDDNEIQNDNLLVPMMEHSNASANDFSFENEEKENAVTDNKVLLVEDNTFNILALVSLFMQFNFECDTSANGHEAIEMVKARCSSGQPMYKLIIMDYSMPECNGTEATTAIRKIVQNRQAIIGVQPLICCLTAYSE